MAFQTRIRSAILLVGSLLLLAPATYATTITVMSYNIHHGEGTDKKVDLERIAGIIRTVAPDLVALQEVDKQTARSGGIDQAAELGRLTGMRALFGRAMDHAGGEYGNAILTNLPVTSQTIHALPYQPTREPRSALEAHIIVTPDDLPTTIAFVGTHLDFGPNPLNRFKAVEAINQLVADQPDLPMILAGDLNAVPGMPAIEKLKQRWTDATSGTTLRTYPVASPRAQIDYILYRPADCWEVLKIYVPDLPNIDVASDHRPIVAVLRLKNGGG